tara:strand:- start:3289 stop:3489 length:201 start_codon:yes stop_codon:yes gene_type:complete
MDDCKRYAGYAGYIEPERIKEENLKAACADLKHKNALLETRIIRLEDAIEGLKYAIEKITPSTSSE